MIRAAIAIANKTEISESSFKASKLKKVSDLLASILGKELGGNFKLLGGSFGTEEFKKKGGLSGKGYKYGNNKGYMVRFGWLNKNKSNFQIQQVDLWEPGMGGSWEKPTMSVTLYDWMNIVDVVAELKTILLTGAISESLDESLEVLSETIKDSNRPPRKMIAFAASKDVSYDIEVDTYTGFINKLKDAGVWDEDEYKGFKVQKGVSETNSTSSTMKKAEKLLAERKFADPDIVFDDIEKLTKVVAMGLQNSLIVAGMAGIGKTFHVEKQMKELLGTNEGPNAKWRHRKGAKLSPFGLYLDLFMNRDDMTIVYDDSDSVWKDADAVNILKSALDTYKERSIAWTSRATTNVEIMDDEEREAYYAKLYDALANSPEDVGTKIKLPSGFKFTSRVIFISNLKPEKIDSAIRSRSLFMDIYLTQTDVIRRIRSILPFVEPSISMEDKLEVLDSLIESGGDLTMRAVTAGIAVKSGGFNDWKRLVSEYS